MIEKILHIITWGIHENLDTRQTAAIRLVNLVSLVFMGLFLLVTFSFLFIDTTWGKTLKIYFFILSLGFIVPLVCNYFERIYISRIVFILQILLSYFLLFIFLGTEGSMRAFILPISILIIMLFSNQEQGLQLFFLLVMGAVLGWAEFLPKEMVEWSVYIPKATIGVFRLVIWISAVSMNLLVVGTAMRMVSQGEDRLRELLIEANKQNDWLQNQDQTFKENQEELLSMNEQLMEQRERLEELIAERSTRLRYTEAQLLRQVEELADSEKELRKYAEEMQLTNERLAAAKTKLQDTLNREREANEQLAKTIEELRSTQAQLTQAEKMASLGQLTAGIAHEINNPINFVYAGMDALQTNIEELLEWTDKNSIKKEYQNEYDDLINETRILLRDIQTGAKRTFEIVKGLRNFSRLDSEEVRKTHINDHISTTLILLRNQIKEYGITIQRELDQDISEIECYPGQLNQVLMNILSNAIHALKEKQYDATNKPLLLIRTQNQENTIQLEIKDNGIGMSEQTQKRIFDPFFTTKEVGEGTGLGMSISYGIIERHQGTIQVESIEGEGTSFIITLPKKMCVQEK